MTETREHTVEPLDVAVDHVRGPRPRPLILEYGDYATLLGDLGR
jgi:hypothetical protein